MGFSIESALRLEQKFDPVWFVPSTTHLSKYLEIRKIYYPTQGYEAGLYIGKLNYTQEITKLKEMSHKLQNDTFMATNIITWVDPFRYYVKSNFHKGNNAISIYYITTIILQFNVYFRYV